MSSPKPRVIKDFEKLDVSLQEQIKLAYPTGFSDHLIHFYDREGKKITALPFETEDKYYMLRMTLAEAKQIVEDDEDYGEDGVLKASVREGYEGKYGDLEYMADYISDGGESSSNSSSKKQSEDDDEEMDDEEMYRKSKQRRNDDYDDDY